MVCRRRQGGSEEEMNDVEIAIITLAAIIVGFALGELLKEVRFRRRIKEGEVIEDH